MEPNFPTNNMDESLYNWQLLNHEQGGHQLDLTYPTILDEAMTQCMGENEAPPAKVVSYPAPMAATNSSSTSTSLNVYKGNEEPYPRFEPRSHFQHQHFKPTWAATMEAAAMQKTFELQRKLIDTVHKEINMLRQVHNTDVVNTLMLDRIQDLERSISVIASVNQNSDKREDNSETYDTFLALMGLDK
jgi:hypothetical protein